MIENIQLRNEINIKPVEFIPNDEEKMVRFGDENDFPFFVLNLYENDSLLHSILTTVSTYVMGDGFDGEDRLVNKHNETLKEVVGRCVTDFVVFGAFSVQVIRDHNGDVAELYHIKNENVRRNEYGDRIFYRRDWKRRTREYVYEGNNNNANDSIFYFKSASSRSVYGQPYWSACFKDSLSNVRITEYNLNTVSNAFTPSAIVTMIGEQPTDDEKKKIKRELEDRFCGSENNSGLLISFAEDADHTPKIETFNGDGNTDRYLQLRESTRENIMTSCRMQPILLGSIESSSGFNSLEFSSAFKLTNKTLIAPIQKEVEKSFLKIKNSDGTSPFDIKFKEFTIVFDEE